MIDAVPGLSGGLLSPICHFSAVTATLPISCVLRLYLWAFPKSPHFQGGFPYAAVLRKCRYFFKYAFFFQLLYQYIAADLSNLYAPGL